MNRIIKFRAYDIRNKEYILDIFHIIGEVTMFDLLKQFSINELDQIIVEQFTGIQDVNGLDIYEGDEIEVSYGTGQVIFHHGSFMILWTDDLESNMEFLGFDKHMRQARTDLKVIGNIHQKITTPQQ